jgi:CubicO group peptidase (beta-lactamase class C family)
LVDRGAIAGAVAIVADRSRILSIHCAGYADLESRRPVEPDTIFWIASTLKAITTAGFMMLVDRGLACLDDPVQKHLPMFAGQRMILHKYEYTTLLKAPSRPITLLDLLTYSSGLPFQSKIESALDIVPLNELTVSYAMTDLLFEPGLRFEYSNAGINIIGRIMEVLSGLSFDEYMKQHIFKPLGMVDTVCVPDSARARRMSTHYGEVDGKLQPLQHPLLTHPLTRPDRQPFPGGGYLSTAADVTRFGQMMLSGGTLDGRTYLSPRSVRLMTTVHRPYLKPPAATGPGHNITLGWGGIPGTVETLYTPDPDEPVNPENALLGKCNAIGALGNGTFVDANLGLTYSLMIQGLCWGKGTGVNQLWPTFNKGVEAIHQLARS